MIKFLQSGSKTTKYLLGGMLLILCGSMVTFLIPGFMSDSTVNASNTVASVGGHSIQIADVQRAAADFEQQQRQRIPEQFRYLLNRQAISQLTQDAEISYEAERMGLRVSDQELQDTLRTGPDAQFFFPGGKWIGQEQYEQLLRNAGLTPESYERRLKLSLLKQKMFITIVAGINVTPAELEKAYKEENTKIKFDYAVITPDDIQKQIKPSDAELKAFYTANKARYENSIPEKRQVRYFVIDQKQAESKAAVTSSDLQQYYNSHETQYQVPETVKVRHILIKTPLPGPDGKVDQKAVDAARAKAEDLLKQLKNGANFAELAKKNSEDTTASVGGDLGWIKKGQMVAPFENSAFSMNKGQMSDLVQTNYGFHIIQTEDKQDAHLKPFSEVKDEIEKKVKQQKVGAALNQMADAAQTQARAESLDKAAASIGSQVVQSNPVSRQDSLPGVGPAPEFMQGVFSAAPKSGPQFARLGQGYAVFEVTRIDPPKTPAFEEIKDKVSTDFKADQTNVLLQKKVQELADRAHAEHDLRKAAKEVGATIKTSDLVSGKDQVPDIGSMSGAASEAFKLKSGEITGPLTAGRNGVVIAITERKEPSPEEMAKGSDQVRMQLIQQKQQQVLSLFIDNLDSRLKKEGKLKINQAVYNNLTNGRG
ncbi:MAG TPA: peptidylprolyl isomerase [Candidatus Solibacter sp.]|nr:peptidylprolyl isomerase [Candidatus Solibacter sp.]